MNASACVIYTETWRNQCITLSQPIIVFVKDASFFPFLYLPFTNRETPSAERSEAWGRAERGVFAQIAELSCKHNMSIFVTSLSKYTVTVKIHDSTAHLYWWQCSTIQVNIDKITTSIFTQPISESAIAIFTEELSRNSITNKEHETFAKRLWLRVKSGRAHTY